MRRRFVGFALLVTILTGCGSSQPKVSTSAAAQAEAHSIAALRKKDEAETYSPAEIKAREQADREAVAHAPEYERHEKAQRESEESQQESREEAAERAKEARQENEPNSHHYPPAVRHAFVHECERTSGHQDSTCECTVKRVEAKIPLGQYRQQSREVADGRRSLPLIYSIEAGYCIGEEVAGAAG